MSPRVRGLGAPFLPKLVLLLAIFAAGCTSAPEPERAGELIFPGGEPTPTSVPVATPVESTTPVPAQLAFAEWTTDDLVNRLQRALDDPITIRLTGIGEETLEISGESWRVTSPPRTPGSSSEAVFVTRGQGSDEWVTYEHVRAGSLAMQTYVASVAGQDIDELIESPASTKDAIVQQFLADRAIFEQTTDLATMWVPHDRNEDAFFTPSVLHPAFVDDVLEEITKAIAAADIANTLETTSTADTFEAELSGTEFSAVTVDKSGARITIRSTAGWTLVMSNGVEDPDELGLPNVRDILTDKLLPTQVSLPEGCATPVIEARAIVENGIVICDGAVAISEVIAIEPDASGPVE